MFSRRLATFLALAACLTACDDGITDADRIAVNFSTTSDTIFKSASVELTPTVTKGGVATNATITWTSSDTLVAKVNSSGVVTGTGRGSAIISAQVRSARASTTIVVDSLREVRVAPSSPAIVAGDSIRLIATGVGVLRTVELGSELTWISSDTSVAAVRDNGTVVARRAGAITVTAGLAGVSTTTSIGVLPTTLNRSTVCAGTGTLHHGTIANETWRAADNPHILLDTVTVAQLTVEPGAVVCGLPNAKLKIVSGSAAGTAERPILFTAADPNQKWFGINTTDSASITHAVIERATRGVLALSGSLVLHDSKLQGVGLSGCEGGHFAARLYILRTVIDSANACLIRGVFQDNLVTRGSVRIHGDRSGARLEINGGRIEDSPGVGLTAQYGTTANLPAVSSTRPLRIINSGSYPVEATLKIFAEIWPTRTAQDSLLGNGKDTLSLWGNGDDDLVSKPLFLRSDLPWLVSYQGEYFLSGVHVHELTIEAGASLTLKSQFTAHASISAQGTSASPIRIKDVTPTNLGGLRLAGSGSSILSHVTFTGFMIGAEDQHTVAIDHLDSNGWIQLASAGSSISDSRVHDVTQAGVGPGAISIRASNVRVLRSDIINNRRDGVYVSSEVGGGVEIHETNLINNEFGVRNFALFQVDARRNWWGDPAGPDGPAGDGISGNVDASEHLTAPRP